MCSGTRFTRECHDGTVAGALCLYDHRADTSGEEEGGAAPSEEEGGAAPSMKPLTEAATVPGPGPGRVLLRLHPSAAHHVSVETEQADRPASPSCRSRPRKNERLGRSIGRSLGRSLAASRLVRKKP